jgi:glycosyltransferase involved in cell wall biosynthesis
VNNDPLPLVSIVVRTHNRADQLERAIRCLVNQTYRPLEIFVVDHNSTDNTADVARSFGDIVTYYLHQGSFRDTFNVWRDKVRGGFISVLDDDDYITPDCLAKLMRPLLSRPEIDVAFSRHRLFHVEHDRCVIEMETGRVDTSQLKRYFLVHNAIPWNAVVFRRKCLERVPRIEDPIVGGFDYYFWILMVLEGFQFHQVDEFLGYLQRSTDSVQFQLERMVTGGLQCMEYLGKHLSFAEKLTLGYYQKYGIRLITRGILCLENGNISLGRSLLRKGLLVYSFGISKRETLIPALIIWFSCLISQPEKARTRVERLFGSYLFRNYHQTKEAQKNPMKKAVTATIIQKMISLLYRKEKASVSLWNNGE